MTTARIINSINPIALILTPIGGALGAIAGTLLSIPFFNINDPSQRDSMYHMVATFSAMGVLTGNAIATKINFLPVDAETDTPPIPVAEQAEQKEMPEPENELLKRITASELSQDDIPRRFICPITREIMNHPVMASDGHNYEEWAIKKAMGIKMTSPISRKSLNPTLYYNRDLKSEILEFVEENERKLVLKR